jgi:hypothetical protein
VFICLHIVVIQLLSVKMRDGRLLEVVSYKS